MKRQKSAAFERKCSNKITLKIKIIGKLKTLSL